MTTRVQTLRSSTTGNVPAAGTRMPGELWTNFPDLQMGVIDASKNAQRLVAVRYFSTQANYVVGDFVIQAGALYVAKAAVTAGAFNAGQWTYIGSSTDPNGPFLPLVGGTLTGALTLAADPGAALGAATKQYVDGKVTAAPYLPIAGGTMAGMLTLAGPPTNPTHAATKAYVDSGSFMPVSGGANTGLNDNRIINGDMRVDARNNGASGTASGYTIDRWLFSPTIVGKGTWGRGLNSIPGPVGFPYYLGFQSSSAYTPLAADQFTFYQAIEADMISDFAWGATGAQSVTLSFWVRSNLTGTFGGAVTNYASTRSYPFTYSIPTAGAWTKIAVTIPGDTAGTWVMSGNAGSIYLGFDLGSGATYRGPAGAWASANYAGATGSVNVVATNAATFYLTGVKLEIGGVATPFNRQSLAKSTADCARYYLVIPQVLLGGYPAIASQPFWSPLSIMMRAAPTAAFSGFTYSGGASGASLDSASSNVANIKVIGPASGSAIVWGQGTVALSAEL